MRLAAPKEETSAIETPEENSPHLATKAHSLPLSLPPVAPDAGSKETHVTGAAATDLTEASDFDVPFRQHMRY